MQPIIIAENLCKDYVTYQRDGGFGAAVKGLFVRKKLVVQAVKGISFSIAPGEIVGLLGENGAGKSTIIKMLTGVLVPTSGQAQVLGYVPFQQRRHYVAHIGAVFGQKSQLIWDIPPLDSFRLNKALYAVSNEDYTRRLDNMLERLNIQEVVRRPTRVLSLGERMKCEFVMTMLHGPKVVFLDEPTIGVDLLAKETIRDFIRAMNADGVTFILTTHDLGDVEKLASRVIIINNGEAVFDDSLTALKHHMGDKKTVELVIQDADRHIEDLLCPGVELLSGAENDKVRLRIDNEVMKMNEFLVGLGQMGCIQNISIMDMGIDEIIKSIYKTPKTTEDNGGN